MDSSWATLRPRGWCSSLLRPPDRRPGPAPRLDLQPVPPATASTRTSGAWLKASFAHHEHGRRVDDQRRSALLLVRRVVILAQDTLHCHPHLGPDALLLRPVDAGVLLDRLDQVPCDGPQGLVPRAATALSFVPSASQEGDRFSTTAYHDNSSMVRTPTRSPC
jgi:hypothetical protein